MGDAKEITGKAESLTYREALRLAVEGYRIKRPPVFFDYKGYNKDFPDNGKEVVDIISKNDEAKFLDRLLMHHRPDLFAPEEFYSWADSLRGPVEDSGNTQE